MVSEQIFTLITGASSGLGKEIAIECARRHRNVALVSLPGRNLNNFCHQLQEKFNITATSFETDLTRKESIFDVFSWVKQNFRVDCLINNAGVGGSFPFDETLPDSIDRMIQLNVKALVLLTRLLMPELKSHRKSYILNVASIAALSPVPYKVVYAASKSFILSFSRGLREEMKDTGIRVSVLLPGPMLTNPDVIGRIIQQGFLGRLWLLSPGTTSRIALNGLFLGKSVIVPGIANKMNFYLVGFVPLKMKLNLLYRIVHNEFVLQKA